MRDRLSHRDVCVHPRGDIESDIELIQSESGGKSSQAVWFYLFTTVSPGHCLWSKTVPLFCLFLTQLWHVVSTWSTVDLL